MKPGRMDALATLPVFLKLDGKRAVLAGGSEAAAWKAELLSAAGAAVDIYAETVSAEIEHVAAAASNGTLTIHRRVWQADDLAGAAIAIGAITDDAEAAHFVTAARAHGVPVNVVDRPEFCAFQFGAIVNRSPLIVAISTDGGAPVFAQAIRSRIEALLPDGFKQWAAAAKSWRRQGDRLGRDISARRRFWELFTERAVANASALPTERDLDALVAEADAISGARGAERGFVSLVGAGPGDAELLTLKAVRALRSADVVLYDDLVTPAVLDFARREARRILVGKTGYGPACKQTEINALMVEEARHGRRVVRLKSGDPMIFGRGGEEIAELEAAGIAFEVVPGISAVQAAAASLQVSLTHRDHAKRLQVVTGHSREGRLPSHLDWQALADPTATTAVYMALRTLPELRAKLLDAGLPGTTPACALFSIARSNQTVVVSTVSDLPDAIARARGDGPCLVLIGAALSAARVFKVAVEGVDSGSVVSSAD
ncbi:MAG: siroheme synthase CysG [Hyphomicrobium sp.]